MRKAFHNRKCFTLPVPGTEHYDNLKLDECSPLFRERMNSMHMPHKFHHAAAHQSLPTDLTSFLTTHTPVKKFKDPRKQKVRPVTGMLLSPLLDAWVEAINQGSARSVRDMRYDNALHGQEQSRTSLQPLSAWWVHFESRRSPMPMRHTTGV